MDRCETCRHWEIPVTDQHMNELRVPDGWGECNMMSGSAFEKIDTLKVLVSAAYAQDVGVFTRPDFGCVQYEPKGGAR